MSVLMTNTGVQILEVGDLVATRYRLTEEIGRGAMGIVYRANQEEMNREVALKTLLPQAVFHPRMIARFKREVRVISQLKHPNTITIFDYGDLPNGLLYFAMEMLDGTPLGTVIKTEGSLAPERVRRVSMQILKSLDEAHSKGIIHRDLKPDNIFICDVHGESDFVKVLDFGIAKALDPGGEEAVELTGTGMSVGTPVYMAPEQIEREDVAAATDLYGLGSLMYEMLSGRPLFLGTSWIEIAMKKLGETPVKLRGDIVSSELGGIIVKALRRDMSERYQTAREMLDDLEAVGVIESGALPPTRKGGIEAETPIDAMIVDTPFGPRVVTSPGVDLSKYDKPREPKPDDSTQIDRKALLEEVELSLDEGEMEDERTRVESALLASDAETFDYGAMGADGVILSDSVEILSGDAMAEEPTRVHSHRDVNPDDVDTRVRHPQPMRRASEPIPDFGDDAVTHVHNPTARPLTGDDVPTMVRESLPSAVVAAKLPSQARGVIVELNSEMDESDPAPRGATRLDIQLSASLDEGDPAPAPTPEILPVVHALAPPPARVVVAEPEVRPAPLEAQGGLLTTQNTLLLMAGLAIMFMLLLAVVLLITAVLLMG